MTRKPRPVAERAAVAATPVEPAWDVEPDPAEVAARWRWVDPQVRRERAVPAAMALADRVRRRDRQGVEILMSRFTDWGALAVVLAGWVDPVKARNAA